EAEMHGVSYRTLVSIQPGVTADPSDRGLQLAAVRDGASAETPDLPSLLLIEAPPDAGVLIGRERPLEAGGTDGAGAADRLGANRLIGSRRRRPDREEEVGVLADAGRVREPPHLTGIVSESSFSHGSCGSTDTAKRPAWRPR